MDTVERMAWMAHSRTAGFQKKVLGAQDIACQALAIAPAFCSISWGKDSVAMAHLVRALAPDIPLVFVCEPESRLLDSYDKVIAQWDERFGLGAYHELTIPLTESNVRSAMNGRNHQALNPYAQWPLSFIGLRKEESRARAVSGAAHGVVGTYADGLRHRALPLFYWTWRDVWAYTVSHNLPFLDSYEDSDKRHSRTSAVTWVQNGGGVRGMEYGRIQRMKEQAPEYYQKLIAKAPWLKS